MSAEGNERKWKEAEFHSRRERLRITDPKAYEEITRNKKYYAINRASKTYMDRWLGARLGAGTVALDYCCGAGANAIEMAKCGASVAGIDISEESVASARSAARDCGIDHRITFVVGDAENTGFPDSTFDIVLCNGVLHHLDVERAYPELARIVKPQGAVFCVEALAHNPAFQLYRRLTPHMRTEWETDHILSRRKILGARRYFGEIDLNFFHLLDLMAVPVRSHAGLFEPLLKALSRVDRLVLSAPALRWWAWQCLFVLRKPRDK